MHIQIIITPKSHVLAVQLSGEPNKASDPSMRSLRSDIQYSLKQPVSEFQWPVHAALLRKLSKVVDIKSDTKNTIQMNGSSGNLVLEAPPVKRTVTLADVSVNTGKSLSGEDIEVNKPSEPAAQTDESATQPEEKEVVVENVTVEIQHNITPKKSSLKLDLKKGTSQLSTSLLNISSQIKSVTTHKRIVSTTGPKRPQSQIECYPVVKEEKATGSTSQQSTPKSVKSSRPLVNTKSPNVLIYSDSVVARDNLEASLRKVLDCDR